MALAGRAAAHLLRQSSERIGEAALPSSSAVFARGLQHAEVTSPDDITVKVRPYEVHRIDAPSDTVKTNKDQLLKFFTAMYRMRRMEIAADMMYKAKYIRGFCHLYDGQEAVLVGMEESLNFKDSIITSYRDHCTHLGRGGTVLEVMAELMGRATGATKGLGGSMHMYKKDHGFYGGCGIVGAQVPLGAGLGYAHKYRKDNSVAVTMYGDGAANQGQIFEAFNMAALWNLPVLFICENNHYGMGTSDIRGSKSAKYYTRGDYMPGIKVDGMDALAVMQATAHAKEYAVKNGPLILEMDTYRFHGHSMSDPGSTYRTRDEIQGVRQARDPIEHIRKLILEHKIADVSELKKREKAIKKEVDTAVEEAKTGPLPKDELLWKNIYMDGLGSHTRGRDSKTKIQL